MPDMFAIAVQLEHTDHRPVIGGWNGIRELPTFYLHPNVQGITGEAGAERVARNLVRTVLDAATGGLFTDDGTVMVDTTPNSRNRRITPHIHAVRVNVP